MFQEANAPLTVSTAIKETNRIDNAVHAFQRLLGRRRLKIRASVRISQDVKI